MKVLVWLTSILFVHTIVATGDGDAVQAMSPEARTYVGYLFDGVLDAVAEGAAQIAAEQLREQEEERAWQEEHDAMVQAAREEVAERNRQVQAHFDRADEHQARAEAANARVDEHLALLEAANARADEHLARAEELNGQLIDGLQALGADPDHTQKVVRETNARFKNSMHRDGLITKVAPGVVIALIVGYKLVHYLLVQPAEGCP